MTLQRIGLETIADLLVKEAVERKRLKEPHAERLRSTDGVTSYTSAATPEMTV